MYKLSETKVDGMFVGQCFNKDGRVPECDIFAPTKEEVLDTMERRKKIEEALTLVVGEEHLDLGMLYGTVGDFEIEF